MSAIGQNTPRRWTACAGRYGIAVAAVLAATICRLVFDARLEDSFPFLFYYSAVVLVGLFAGTGPGILSLALSTLASIRFMEASIPEVQIWRNSQTAGLISFIVLGAFMLSLIGAQRRTRARILAASRSAKAEAAQLELEIAERQRVEAALRRSQIGLATAQRIAHLGNWELDLANRSMTCSDEAYRVLGAEPGHFAGNYEAFMQHVHPDDRPLVNSAIEQAIAHGTPCNVDHRVILPNGEQRIVNEQAELIADHDGKPTRLLGTVLDITERKRGEEQLRSSEQRTRMIINSELDALVLMDPQGIITDWNPQSEALFGWPRQQVVGKPLDETIIPMQAGQPHAAGLRRFLSSGKDRLSSRRIELNALHRDGREFPVELSISPFKLQDAIVFSAFIRDISDRKRGEEALRASNEMQKLLLSELNHRVRNNLAGLISLIDMSASTAADIPSLASTISSRVHSMAAVHAMLSHSSWGSIAIEEIIGKLLPHGRRGRLEIHGPNVQVPAQQCTPFGMVIGELMANSLKYGALASPTGLIDVTWAVHDGHDMNAAAIEMTWTERGGPPIESEPQPHLGTSLIRGFMRSDLRGQATLEYPLQGASHRFVMTFDYSHQPLPAGGK
jgi:PAS domain S-box-containing protein